MPKNAFSFAFLFIVFIAVVAFAAYKGPTHAQTPPAPVLSRGIAYLKGDTSVYQTDSALIASLPKAVDPSDVGIKITSNTTTLVVDKESFPTLPQSLLKQKLTEGVSIIALNVPLSTLLGATDFLNAINADTSHRRDLDMSKYDPNPKTPFYSYVAITPAGADYFRYNIGQKEFRNGLFTSDMTRHLAGVNSDIGVKK